jgi:glc operon protein GlcG
MKQTYQLSHHDAQKIVAVIQTELDAQRKGAAVAVTDSHGELLAFVRTDGCPLASIAISMNKAFTASRERKESFQIGQSAREDNWPLSNYGDPRYIGWGGGAPIFYEGEVVGGVGVSGLPEKEDIVLARKGAAALTS